MKQILLVAPNTKHSIFESRWVTAPLGVHRIASFLNANSHYTEVWDMNLAEISFENKLKERSWDIVGFSTLEATVEYDLSKIHLAKKISPQSILVAGGTNATLNYQLLFDKSPLDIVVLAEGEYPMLDLCNDKPWQDIDGIVFKKRARLLNPIEYWEINKCLDVRAMKADKYWAKTSMLYDSPNIDEINTFRLYTMNYCPMGCAFCTLSNLRKYSTGRVVPVLSLTPEQIMELVKRVLVEYKEVRQIFFVDDDFFLVKQRTIDICERIIKAKKENELPAYLRFICLTNINRIDEDTIGLIAEAGFRILSIGVESVSQNVLDSLDKNQTVKQIWENTELILSYGIKPYYTLLLFTPYGTVKDLLIDLEGFRKLSEMEVGLSLEPYLIPLHGTKLWENNVPCRTRRINIEGTNEHIVKAFAWLPEDEQVLEIFKYFEKVYPKYRKYRFENDGIKHKEKNYQAGVILDTLELVLRWGFEIEIDNPRLKDINSIMDKVYKTDAVNVDTIGDFVC